MEGKETEMSLATSSTTAEQSETHVNAEVRAYVEALIERETVALSRGVTDPETRAWIARAVRNHFEAELSLL